MVHRCHNFISQNTVNRFLFRKICATDNDGLLISALNPTNPRFICRTIYCRSIIKIIITILMSFTASLVTANRVQQCFTVLTNIFHVFLFLLNCCILWKQNLLILDIASEWIWSITVYHRCASFLLHLNGFNTIVIYSSIYQVTSSWRIANYD